MCTIGSSVVFFSTLHFITSNTQPDRLIDFCVSRILVHRIKPTSNDSVCRIAQSEFFSWMGVYGVWISCRLRGNPGTREHFGFASGVVNSSLFSTPSLPSQLLIETEHFS